MIGIYKITSPSNRVYIGQSKDIPDRIKRYKMLRCEKQIRLYASLNKYGFDNHVFEVLEECAVEILDCRERHYQDLFDVTSKKGLNCDLVNSLNSPKIRSKETRVKIALGMTGKTNFLGKKHTEENRIKMRNRHIGRVVSEVTKQKLRNHNLGKKYSQETKIKQSENSGVIRTVLDLNTGIFWRSTKEVSLVYGIKQNTLITRLNGYRKNNTQFTYV